MVLAAASALGGRFVTELCRRSGGTSPDHKMQIEMMAAAHVQVFGRA